MKYFLDTEFIEGFHKPLFGKRRHHIDLISIGIVAEDGREFYAISNEFNPKDANDWVKENVIRQLPKKHFNGHNVEEAKLWKSNAQIAKEIVEFINSEPIKTVGSGTGTVMMSKESEDTLRRGYLTPTFYGYYADYDWVLFCSLFGTMMDLPKGFPMYMIDLKQILDERVSSLNNSDFFTKLFVEKEMTLKEKLIEIKKHTKYPQQENEHNALADAKWNMKLYNFLKTI